MSSTYDMLVRCHRCDFVIQPGEPRLRDDYGWIHPTCLLDGEEVGE